MSQQKLIDFLVSINTRQQKGEVFTGGTLIGQNIQAVFGAMSRAELQEEYNSYCC